MLSFSSIPAQCDDAISIPNLETLQSKCASADDSARRTLRELTQWDASYQPNPK
ncbi:hypothetical protein [Chamaesiphon polymorphus]|uniref:hypothetical protein n=1 Tax=Chamaesiphon polymorphus TaxID=2107691 RepID=UPI0015E6657F|nr:hypothetical protein [Chamaesiphon polymorphus]